MTDDAPHNDAARAVILFAHGSRDPLWRVSIEAVQSNLSLRQPTVVVRCAYLELCDPSLPEVVDALRVRGITWFTVVPMFLGTGRHAREDLPALVAQLQRSNPCIRIDVQQAIGEDSRMTALMALIASETEKQK